MKILLINYYFPPLTGPRSLRWSQFTSILCKNKNYEFDVITIDPLSGSGNYQSDSLRSLHPGVRVYRVNPGLLHSLVYNKLPVIQPPKAGSKPTLKKFLRNFLKSTFNTILEPALIPDKTFEWIREAKSIHSNISANKYDCVISSALPYSDHLIGEFYRDKFKCPWILDYGDPWIFNPNFPGWRKWIDKTIESRILKKADLITLTTEETRRGFKKTYPFLLENKFKIVTQGYDSGSFSLVEPERGKKFRIVYTGIFYDKSREPNEFLKAVAAIQDIDFEIIVAGDVQQKYVDAAKNFNIRNIEFIGHQSYLCSTALQKGADLLLLWGWPNGFQVPAKLFEYFGAGKPIFSIYYDQNDIAKRLIAQERKGESVPNDAAEIEKRLKSIILDYNQWKKSISFSEPPVSKYSWEVQANLMDEAIRGVTFK